MTVVAAELATVAPASAASAASGATNDTAVRPFRVRVPERDLADLRRRIAATRWPDRETVTSQGVPLALMQEVAAIGGTSTTGEGSRRD
jgi:hypothetical protein